MEKQEFLDRIKAVGTCEKDEERREMLASLSDEVSKDYDSLTKLTTDNQNLTNDNELLRQANMKLFLRVGEQKDTSQEHKKDDVSDDNKKRNFEDLFDEKGGLK